jgi:mannose-6-phosphate isomerase-like protein (cupin superfamily)
MSFADHTDDAVTIAPHIHQVIFENEKFRVLKVTVRPADKADMHWHPENINYILKPGTLRFAKPDGSKMDVELTDGHVTSSPESSHSVENIGITEVQTIQVEMKG